MYDTTDDKLLITYFLRNRKIGFEGAIFTIGWYMNVGEDQNVYITSSPLQVLHFDINFMQFFSYGINSLFGRHLLKWWLLQNGG